MRRRLFDGLDDGLGEELIVLEDLPGADERPAYCGLCRALQVALGLLGRPVPFHRLMASTGAAFMMPIGEGLMASWKDPSLQPYLTVNWDATDLQRNTAYALDELGLEAQSVGQPDELEARGLCRLELQAKRPVLAEGWVGDWAVVVGIKGRELLGHVPGSKRQLEQHAPAVHSLLLLKPVREPAGGLAADLDVLDEAWQILYAGLEQWTRWQQSLEDEEPYGTGAGVLERFYHEQHLVGCLVEARDAAAQFLREVADQLDYEAAEAVAHAADLADRQVELLEQLLAPPEVSQAAHLAHDAAWLDRRREMLGQAARQDEELADAIETAMNAAGEVT